MKPWLAAAVTSALCVVTLSACGSGAITAAGSATGSVSRPAGGRDISWTADRSELRRLTAADVSSATLVLGADLRLVDRASDDRRLTLAWEQGDCVTVGLYIEGTDTEVRLLTRVDGPPPLATCNAALRHVRTVITLGEPVGNRSLVGVTPSPSGQ